MSFLERGCPPQKSKIRDGTAEIQTFASHPTEFACVEGHVGAARALQGCCTRHKLCLVNGEEILFHTWDLLSLRGWMIATQSAVRAQIQAGTELKPIYSYINSFIFGQQLTIASRPAPVSCRTASDPRFLKYKGFTALWTIYWIILYSNVKLKLRWPNHML